MSDTLGGHDPQPLLTPEQQELRQQLFFSGKTWVESAPQLYIDGNFTHNALKDSRFQQFLHFTLAGALIEKAVI